MKTKNRPKMPRTTIVLNTLRFIKDSYCEAGAFHNVTEATPGLVREVLEEAKSIMKDLDGPQKEEFQSLYDFCFDVLCKMNIIAVRKLF